MNLSKQQKYIVETIRKLGCMRKTQLLKMTAAQFTTEDFEVSENRLDAMLYQLRIVTGDIRFDENAVWCINSLPDAKLLEAIDIMLELSDNQPQDFRVNLEKPCILRFLMGTDRLRIFTIAYMEHPIEISILRKRMERIIWIPADDSFPRNVVLPAKHFFAVRQSDGSHRFYGSNEL